LSRKRLCPSCGQEEGIPFEYMDVANNYKEISVSCLSCGHTWVVYQGQFIYGATPPLTLDTGLGSTME
jgi:hypothetical protein